MTIMFTCIGIHTPIAHQACLARPSTQAGGSLLYRWCNNDLLLDPYAPLISGRRRFGVRDEIEEFEEKVHACA